MPLPGPIPLTFNHLVTAVLQELGVLDSGQPVAAEDADAILLRLYPKLEGLNERDVSYIDIDNITNAQFLPLVKIMAFEMAPAFNITDRVKLAKLELVGGPGGQAEQELKDIVRLRTPRQVLRCETFTGGRRF